MLPCPLQRHMTQTSGSAAGSQRRGGGGCNAQDVLVSIHRTQPRLDPGNKIMSCLSIQACHKLTQVPVRMTRDQADIYQVQSALAAAANSTRMLESLVKLGRCSRTRSPGKSLLLSTSRESMATHNCLVTPLQGTPFRRSPPCPPLHEREITRCVAALSAVTSI